jgi:hypothetical protein
MEPENNNEIKVENLVTKLDDDIIPSVGEQLIGDNPIFKAIYEEGEREEKAAEQYHQKQEKQFDEEAVRDRIERMKAKQEKNNSLKNEQDKKKKNNRPTLTPFPNPYQIKR